MKLPLSKRSQAVALGCLLLMGGAGYTVFSIAYLAVQAKPRPFVEVPKGTPGRDLVLYKKTTDAEGQPVELNLWVFKPHGWTAADRRPAVVFFHGGGWKNGGPRSFLSQCRYFQLRGMVAMTVEYRLNGTHGTTPREATLDARSAMRYVRAHAAELGIDPDHIAAGGGSAGGHLAAATATLTDLNEEGEDPSISAVPNALILINPPLNLDKPEIEEKHGRAAYEMMAALSPYQRVTPDFPPTIIFHGTEDKAVPYESVVEFVKQAQAIGVPDITLKTYEGRDHSAFNPTAGDGSDHRQSIAEMDEFLVRLGWLER